MRRSAGTGGSATGNLSKVPIRTAHLGADNLEQEFTLSLLQNEEQLLDGCQQELSSVGACGLGRNYDAGLQRTTGPR
jgi:hypothetical protein